MLEYASLKVDIKESFIVWLKNIKENNKVINIIVDLIHSIPIH